MTGSDVKRPDPVHEPLRCILVGISSEGETKATPALNQAIDLAQAEKAALSLYVFAPRLREPLPMSGVAASTWLAEESERLEKFTSEATRRALDIVDQAGLDVVSEHPHSPFESRSGRFVQLARVHDLAILDAADISDTSQRTIVEDILFDSGRPLLLIPSHGGALRPRRIAIAWDGSARTARCARPSESQTALHCT